MNETERPRKFRKREDPGFVVEAVRYGTIDSQWRPDSAMKVARFIIGVNDDHIAVANESMLDVVRPVLDQWDPPKGQATIEVIDMTNGVRYTVRLGSWILKLPSGELMICTPAAFRREFEDMPHDAKSALDDLTTLIATTMRWEDEFLAAMLAQEIIKAGWGKES